AAALSVSRSRDQSERGTSGKGYRGGAREGSPETREEVLEGGRGRVGARPRREDKRRPRAFAQGCRWEWDPV
ncbi:unnamed protein product, partial [Lampetra fluviatilis]